MGKDKRYDFSNINFVYVTLSGGILPVSVMSLNKFH